MFGGLRYIVHLNVTQSRWLKMGKRKQKKIFDKEKSEYYGGDRKPRAPAGTVFKDRSKYNRKEKHRKDLAE